VLLVMLAVSLSGLRRLERTLAVLQPTGSQPLRTSTRKPSRQRADADGNAALLTTVAAGSASGAIDCGSSADAGCGGGGE
jgi:hypothetical protein